MTKSFSFLLLITFLNYFITYFFSFNKEIEKTSIIIEKGMKINEVSKYYMKKKLFIVNLHLRLWIKLNFLEKKIKYGEFQISGKNSIYNVTKKFYQESLFIENLH